MSRNGRIERGNVYYSNVTMPGVRYIKSATVDKSEGTTKSNIEASNERRWTRVKADDPINFEHYNKYDISELREICLIRIPGHSRFRPHSRTKVDLIERLLRQDKEHAEAPFRFVDLPAEMRNMIYDLVTVENDKVIAAAAQPAIAKTNKQLRSESLAVYYGANRFWLETKRVSDPKATSESSIRWTQSIRPHDASLKHYNTLMLHHKLLRTLEYDIDVYVNDKRRFDRADMKLRVSIHHNANAKERPFNVKVTQLASVWFSGTWSRHRRRRGRLVNPIPLVASDSDPLCGHIQELIQEGFNGIKDRSITKRRMTQIWRRTPLGLAVEQFDTHE
ncbi:hypothetical protein MBLNU457_g0369t1 [Dothideomycetes sp. NU457]